MTLSSKFNQPISQVVEFQNDHHFSLFEEYCLSYMWTDHELLNESTGHHITSFHIMGNQELSNVLGFSIKQDEPSSSLFILEFLARLQRFMKTTNPDWTCPIITSHPHTAWFLDSFFPDFECMFDVSNDGWIHILDAIKNNTIVPSMIKNARHIRHDGTVVYLEHSIAMDLKKFQYEQPVNSRPIP